jgi:hypothetical protein
MSRTEKAARLATVKIITFSLEWSKMGNFMPSSYVDLYFLCRICSKECGGRAYGPINGLEKVLRLGTLHLEDS